MLKEWTPDQGNSTWAKNIDGICQDVSSVLEEWTSDEVSTWTNNIEGIHKDVSSVLKENEITGQNVLAFNSLTPTCVPAGTKNSRSEDFLLAKHTSHKHPHHDDLFSHLAAWFPWMNAPHPREPLCRGLDEVAIERFSIKL